MQIAPPPKNRCITSVFRNLIYFYRKSCYYSDITHHYTLRNGFTLAEVLITLGIIGIVAAMTIPTLIGNYQKKEVPIRLKKMYNTLWGAISQAELENGPSEYWLFENDAASTEFYNTKIKSKMKCVKNKNSDCYLPDGSMIRLSNMRAYGLLELTFYPFANKKALSYNYNRGQHKRYYFQYNVWLVPNPSINWKLTKPKTEVTHMAAIANNLSRDQLLNGPGPGNAPGEYCKSTGAASCFQLIKRDGWVIKDDYPW